MKKVEFPLDLFEKNEIKEKIVKVLDLGLCNNCLGRAFGMVGHGLSNYSRGKIIRELIKNDKKIEWKEKWEEAKVCSVCKNFFKEKLEDIANKIIKKISKIEFETYLVGSVVYSELTKNEEKIWEIIGIEYAESIKSEINREIGKIIEKKTGKKFDPKNPDLTVVVDLESENIKIQMKSLYVYGEYQKLVRGIPQSKWICSNCKGKGCLKCKGIGKMYKTSVQEIIEKPFIKSSKAKKTAFHSAGREDIDARNLAWRPFVIELKKPIKRKIKLKEIQKKINKSKKVKVRKLKFVEKYFIKKIKSERWDKTYLAIVKFENEIDKDKLKNIKSLEIEPVLQKTPLRVLHRRSDKIRKRKVKKISWKIIDKKTLELKIRAESGLYIKELINGDEGRTKPSIAEILNNKVKKISLDVIKIHTK